MVESNFFLPRKKQGATTMHIKGFLHKMLSSVMQKKRLTTLIVFVITVLNTKKLSLTELGRGIDLPIQERSGIRRADRFLGNEKLYGEREAICEALILAVIGNTPHPDIIVDWSNIPNTTNHVLRAALAAKGRAITLYEEVHPEKKLGNRRVQNEFLHKLKKMFPAYCKPLIITDGGFHNEWFREIVELGWDYLGRIRAGSGKKFRYLDKKEWQNCSDLCKKATTKAAFFGEVDLCKEHPIRTNLYLFKGKIKGRKALNKLGKKRKDTDALDYSKAAREPWILATSLPGKKHLANQVVKKYKKRMQIEEGFRDLKSPQYGFSFEKSYSKDCGRNEVLLLIAMLASFIAWLIGWIGEMQNLHLQFQSNSIKKRRVLSLFYLGCRIIKKKIKIEIRMLELAIEKGLCYA